MKHLLKIVFLVGIAGTAQAAPKAQAGMQDVLEIAHAISVVQPFLSDAEYVSYAIAIQRASKEYGVHPSVLIAITQQESNFRPNLPEGPAGEIGICQIIKSWLSNPNFVREFGKMTPSELRKPATSFRVAAWILADLKGSSLSGPLPYWSFYNSRTFKNRFKYYLKISRNLNTLRQKAPTVYSDAVLMAASDQRPAKKSDQLQMGKARREVAADRAKAEPVKAAQLLYPKRLSKRATAVRRLIQTASLGSPSSLSN